MRLRFDSCGYDSAFAARVASPSQNDVMAAEAADETITNTPKTPDPQSIKEGFKIIRYKGVFTP